MALEAEYKSREEHEGNTKTKSSSPLRALIGHIEEKVKNTVFKQQPHVNIDFCSSQPFLGFNRMYGKAINRKGQYKKVEQALRNAAVYDKHHASAWLKLAEGIVDQSNA